MNLTITNQTCNDIVYNGHYLEKLYFGNDLAWEKQHVHDYSQDYFTIESLEDSNQISFSLEYDGNGPAYEDLHYIAYSTNNGLSWTTTTMDGTAKVITVNVNQNDKILFKGEGTSLLTVGTYAAKPSSFSSTKTFNVCGNIMSLLYGDNFADKMSIPASTISSTNPRTFNSLLKNSKVVNAKNLVLQATTLRNSCYGHMFEGCTSLTTAPELPATSLANNCYNSMFYGCTSLVTAPELPATTLAGSNNEAGNDCYNSMFRGCTSLTTAPSILPATRLTPSCYESMFQDCTSLAVSPQLPALTLQNWCYRYMFKGCTSLNKVTCLATNILSGTAADCLVDWLLNVSATGTFVKNSSMSSWPTGSDGIPTGWTIQDYN